MPSPAVWLAAERVGDHVHVQVQTGLQHGQPSFPDWGPGMRNDAGIAGNLIFRADQWQPFIKALAIGGHATGLRVMWKTAPDDRRFLWNGLPDAPSIVGRAEPEPWERNDA